MLLELGHLRNQVSGGLAAQAPLVGEGARTMHCGRWETGLATESGSGRDS